MNILQFILLPDMSSDTLPGYFNVQNVGNELNHELLDPGQLAYPGYCRLDSVDLFRAQVWLNCDATLSVPKFPEIQTCDLEVPWVI